MLKNEFYKLKLNIFSSEYLQSSPVVIQRPTGYSKELFSMGGRINLKGVGTFGFTTLSHCTYIILCSRSRVWYNGGRMEGCPLRGWPESRAPYQVRRETIFFKTYFISICNGLGIGLLLIADTRVVHSFFADPDPALQNCGVNLNL